jgi:hypothetical protein
LTAARVGSTLLLQYSRLRSSSYPTVRAAQQYLGGETTLDKNYADLFHCDAERVLVWYGRSTLIRRETTSFRMGSRRDGASEVLRLVPGSLTTKVRRARFRGASTRSRFSYDQRGSCPPQHVVPLQVAQN